MPTGATIRLLADSKYSSATLRDARGPGLFYYRGEDLKVQLSLSTGEHHLISSEVGTIYFSIKALAAAAEDVALFETTFDAADCSGTYANLLDWQAGDDQLIEFEIARASVAFDPGTYLLVIIHEFAGGRRVTHAATQISVLDDQWESPSLATPLTPTVSSQVQALVDNITTSGDLVTAAETSATAAAASAAAAASSLATVSEYVFQRAVLTVTAGFDDWKTPSPHSHITMGNLGIYFVTAPIDAGDYALFTATNQTAIEITGDDADTQHTVAQALVSLINGNGADNQFGLSFSVDDFDSDSLLYARYLGASGPADAYGQLEIVYIGTSSIALSATSAVASWDVSTVGSAQATPFFFKNGEVLTAAQKLAVRNSIFGSNTDIDVSGLLTAGPQAITNPLSVPNLGQLENLHFDARDSTSHHPVGLMAFETVGTGSGGNEGSIGLYSIAANNDQVSTVLDAYFAKGRGSGASSRFDVHNARLGFCFHRTFPADSEIFIELGGLATALTGTPATTSEGIFFNIHRSGSVYTATLRVHDGVNGNELVSAATVTPNLNRLNRFEIRTYTTGVVEVWSRLLLSDSWVLLVSVSGAVLGALSDSQHRRSRIGFRSTGYASGAYGIGIQRVTTSF